MSEKSQVPEGYKKTELGVVPEDWNVVEIGKLVDTIKNGFASGKRDENGIVQIRMNNVTTEGMIIFNKYLKVPIPKDIETFTLKKGDFLFNNTNSIDLVGKSAIFCEAPFDCTFSNHFTRIRFKQNLVLPEIILLNTLILWRTGFFKTVAIRHVGQAAVHSKYLLKRKISLPPLSEQQKIATILSKVDEQIEQTEQIIEKTEFLKKGLMQRLLTKGIGHTKFKKTELGEIPEEWEIKGLTKVFNIIDYRGRTPPFSENGIPYIGADNIKDARIVFNKRRYVSEETYTKYMTRGIPNPDDIFFTTEAPLGNVAQVPEYKFCFAQRVVVFQCKNDFSPLFFMYLLKTKIMQKQFLDWATGTTVTGISSKNMKFIKLYYPKSIQEQKKIGRVLECVDKYIDSEKENLLSLQELKKGLMQDLLTGKVRVCV